MIRILSKSPPLKSFNFSSLSSQQLMSLEIQYGCQNYAPVPVVLAKGEGIHVWDQEGKKYMDFLAGYSAINQGHCHPRILKTMIEQATNLTLTSRAYHNNQLGLAEQYMCQLFKYDKVLFMNSGVEAGESAIKLARRWAYNVKGVPDNQARVLFANGNFWGRTIAACASSDDPDRFRRFGPYGGLNFDLVDYNNLDQIEQAFKSTPNYAAIMIEPIQGEQGIIIPHLGYLTGIKDLCKKYNVLFICDEVQTGLGRTGKMLGSEWENCRPDIVTLAKALSGGFYPISAVLTDDEVMSQIKPGEHGSTFGGNPLASAIVQTALQVLVDENLVENSRILGEVFKKGLQEIKSDLIKEVRGRGLMIGLEFAPDARKKIAWEFCLRLAKKGLLCKTTHEVVIRFTPPLIIKREELDKGIQIIQETFKELEQGTKF